MILIRDFIAVDTEPEPEFNAGMFNIRDFLPSTVRDRLTRQKLSQLSACLTKKEQRALFLRFGVGAPEPQTYERIGLSLGCTKKGAYKIVVRAMAKITEQVKIAT